jgi:sugar phosphate isomerase/epimerase
VARAVADAAELAAGHGVGISLEYHPGTLTDTVPSALAVLAEVSLRRTAKGYPVRLYYQPFRATPADESVRAVRALLEAAHLSNVHVFSWAADGTRLPLADRDDLWRPVLAELAASERRHHAQLEFVAGDDPSRFHADVVTFQAWVRELGEAP